MAGPGAPGPPAALRRAAPRRAPVAGQCARGRRLARCAISTSTSCSFSTIASGTRVTSSSRRAQRAATAHLPRARPAAASPRPTRATRWTTPTCCWSTSPTSTPDVGQRPHPDPGDRARRARSSARRTRASSTAASWSSTTCAAAAAGSGADVFERVRGARCRSTWSGWTPSASGAWRGAAPACPSDGPYRFFFNPIRYTSLGLAVFEAMMVGLPIVGLATTETRRGRDGVSGFVRPTWTSSSSACASCWPTPRAARLGEGARAARERFSLERFAERVDGGARGRRRRHARTGSRSSCTGVCSPAR